jgi:outer membrane protein TolC
LRVVLLFLPLFLFGGEFEELIQSVDKSAKILSLKETTKAYEKKALASEAKNYPSVDLEVGFLHYKDTPTIRFFTQDGKSSMPLPISTKDNSSARVVVSYPLFSGFAITNKIEKSKLEVVKSALKELEAKRELYQSITTLFANLYSANMTNEAFNEAKEASE